MQTTETTTGFTFGYYARLLQLLRGKGFSFGRFQPEAAAGKRALLRHDIDMSIGDALEFARMEHGLGVASTYYVMLDTQLYSVPAAASSGGLRAIAGMGHDIGLHYVQHDDSRGPAGDAEAAAEIKQQCGILADILGLDITTFSFHRPTTELRAQNIDIPGLANAYAAPYFVAGAYISDSNHHWRCGDPVQFISGFGGDHLQVLTHPFWWGVEQTDPVRKLKLFLDGLRRTQQEALIHDVKLAKDAFAEA